MSFFAERSYLVFFIVTCLLGGGAAWATGRALALSWRPFWQLLIFMVLLGFFVRFFHWSLFQGQLGSVYYYAVDTGVLITIASLAFSLMRTHQMVTQYYWLYKRTSPVSWTRR